MSLSRRRSNVLLACVTALLATPANAATAGSRLSAIPAEFHGEWRENPDQCGDRTETGLDISARSLEYYSYTPAMNSIRQAGPRSILVTQTVQRDELGGAIYSRDEVITYEISADGRTLNETDTSGYTVSRVRCGAAQTVAPAPTQIAVDSLIGEWWDGRAACASIRRGRTATSIVFRGWHCEAGEDSATPITLERLGDRVFTHRATDLNVVVHSNRQMNADAGPQSRRRFGDGLFVTEAGQLYGRRAASSGPATVVAPARVARQASPAGADTAFIDGTHAIPLEAWLRQNPQFRMANHRSDFPEWERVLVDFKASWDNEYPFYAFGDFNRDRFEDFAVVLVDTTVRAMPRNFRGNESPYYNASVAVFNGSARGYASRPTFIEKWGFVQSSLLFYSRETNDLMVGQWEGPLAQVNPERNGTYRYYFGE